ncbi:MULTISPECIES: heavy metal translocating P-type ATPase [Lactobacillus]|jgi:heavy metal translocating P-type ATPase|uniref:Cd(2+)-exporting ATPase n=2 Tax=Lactobacillus amylovorus TaxID=1604 RepID=E4SNR8_LACAR|nr:MULTISPECIES: heavy metal translocating P-type ATPase [Lactobacillus]ADQ60009.1 cadmium efflux ATPase [Lactobacillus amylovorus GRL 1112]MCT3600308.1 cadmium-translocating P-type ATPase [Lactobacillus amylovorus]MDB6226274.1 heavy metal translocating P-type ATPase [Lactobacillus amylovorus]MDB6227767.1 heavy metal translocating P-type ATPase [Lactobacillus amylovorus]MDB6230009.1 heavy metal translocating P-type ATPase [Lactobacillus amylovorus]
MKRHWKFIVVLIAGVISLFFEFGIHASTLFTTPLLKLQMNPQAIIIDILGIWISVLLLMEIFEDWKSGRYGVDILAVIAIVSTILINNYWAEWMILVMSTGGETLEDYATGQASKELRSLLNNTPRIANKLVNGQITEVKVNELHIGDIVLIKPGQQVPVDGEIIKGTSSFDQSSLTGESVPVTKKPGDNLMSGSVNGDVAVQMKVTKEAKDSEYQSIVALVKSSQAQPAKFVKMADRYAVPFTIISLIIGGVAWAVSGDATRFAEVMVVASPCPLLIAAPVALVSGMSSMSAHHIIVKSGPTLEKLARAKTFAFDKTGTLTENQLVVDQVVPAEESVSKDELQGLAASVEQQSSHVIAGSLVKATNKDLIKPVTDLKETTAQGVEGNVDGKHVKVGKLKFVAPDHEKIDVNSTAVFVSIDNQFAGYITLMDEMRPETPDTIAKLKRQGAQDIMMLTGDHKAVAERVGNKAGITDIRADLLPSEKIKAIKGVPKNLRPVVMTGDGVNDAPSLTAADVGIAMGAKGATAASESADAVIMVNDLSKINDAVAISKHTMKVANVDVLTAIGVVIIIELIAFTGVIPAFWGAILQEVVDMITISLGLLAKTTPSKKQFGLEE